jgi:SAM-dependent methyltransferase
MKIEPPLIERLHCPFTGSRLQCERLENETGFGIATSEAGRFPIISGVLRLLLDDLRDPLVRLVSQQRHAEALRGALEVPSLMEHWPLLDSVWQRVAGHYLGPFARTATPGKRRVYRLVTTPNTPFLELAAMAGADRWTNWQTYRFSMPTFLAVYPLVHLAAKRRTILDFGCGLGHSAFLIQRLASQADVICADYSFTSLYLAKRFFVPDAQCICLDGNYPLPFPQQHFDCIFSTDALQYINTKVGLIREFQRALHSDGTIVLAHLHNQRSSISAGKALTARGYDGLFEGMCHRLYPEDAIVSDYVSDGSLRLDRQFTAEDLDNATSGLSLVAANTPSVFTTLTGLLDAYIDVMRHPTLNPAYREHSSNGLVSFERTVGPPYAVERTEGSCEILPKRGKSVARLDTHKLLEFRDTQRATLRDLVRRFVVLDLPDSYV